jgi:uncharacterized phage protein (TIGR02218 family)
MRDLPETLAAKLAAGATTLARCWRLIRRDGTVQGFTEHDRDIAFGGVVHQAASGLEAADMESRLGFAVSGGEIAGALVSAGLTEEDLAAGRCDGATVEVWLVDWSDPTSRVLLDAGTIGEVRRMDHAFVAELRSIAHRLDETRGRLFTAACSADLGDRACGIDLAGPRWRATATVTATEGRAWLESAGLAGWTTGLFTGGRLTVETGANAGLSSEIRVHAANSLALWQPLPAMLAVGDRFTVTAGCDKTLATCRDRFANSVNFRGFPHIPGNDFVLRQAKSGSEVMDGGSLFR